MFVAFQGVGGVLAQGPTRSCHAVFVGHRAVKVIIHCLPELIYFRCCSLVNGMPRPLFRGTALGRSLRCPKGVESAFETLSVTCLHKSTLKHAGRKCATCATPGLSGCNWHVRDTSCGNSGQQCTAPKEGSEMPQHSCADCVREVAHGDDVCTVLRKMKVPASWSSWTCALPKTPVL